jgi:sugar/nucleoside kinase (ribokinase family)
MGEMLVEVMRPTAGMPLDKPGEFIGPFPSGAPAIFIDTVARLGHSAGIVGGVAEDDFGRCLIQRLTDDGVDVRYVGKYPDQSTAVAFVTYFEDGSRKFIFHIDGTPAVKQVFSESMEITTPTFFHVMGCSLMANDRFREEILSAVRHFHSMGSRISFDPNIRVELLGEKGLMDVIGPVLSRTAVLLPGEAELRLVSGEQDIKTAVGKMFENPVLEVIVLKQGKSGARVYTREEMVPAPAYEIQEVDPTGAGDCFDAGFLCGLLEGKSLVECGKIAAAAGALNAAAFGPMEGEISPETIRNLIETG